MSKVTFNHRDEVRAYYKDVVDAWSSGDTDKAVQLVLACEHPVVMICFVHGEICDRHLPGPQNGLSFCRAMEAAATLVPN